MLVWIQAASIWSREVEEEEEEEEEEEVMEG